MSAPATPTEIGIKQAQKLWGLLHTHFVNFERVLEEILDWESLVEISQKWSTSTKTARAFLKAAGCAVPDGRLIGRGWSCPRGCQCGRHSKRVAASSKEAA